MFSRLEYECAVCEQPISGKKHKTVEEEFVCDECVEFVPVEDLEENRKEISINPYEAPGDDY